MTISSTVRKAGPFVGNGTASAFPFYFKVFQASDLLVVKLATSTSIEQTLALTTDYTVALNPDQDSNPGGTVTLVAGALATGFTLTITSDISNLQPTDITNQGGFYPEVIEDSLDRATIQIQQLQEESDRALTLPLSTPSSVSTELPPPQANYLIGWNEDADGLQNFDGGSLATVVAYGTARGDIFSGDGIQTVFVLTSNPGAQANLDVSISGVTQRPGLDYTWISGTNVTFTSPPPAGTNNILIRYWLGLPQGYTDSANSTFIQSGVSAIQRTVQNKLREFISVKDFGAVGDGVTDDTNALATAAASLQNGQTLYFPNGTYLISYQGAPYSSVNGNTVMPFNGKSDLAFISDSATIKINNHNITTYGGLMFMSFTSCKRVKISGFNFDMTFTGVNTSASYYPFVGAIITSDSAGAFSTLCSDFIVEKCTFKLFHPYGQFALSGAPYLGDPNNGYKMLSLFFDGVYTATTYATQNRNVTVRDITFLDGHNGYGVWFWAWNDCTVDNVSALSWVGKVSNSNGTFAGGGLPCIRYHQFYCEGIKVVNSYFRAKPCDERLIAGFEGNATLVGLTTNNSDVDLTNGYSLVENNIFILGNGDAANSMSDYGFYADCYGDIIVQGNTFDGIVTSTPNSTADSECVRYNASATGGNGHGTFICSNNIFGSYSSANNNIVFSNGSVSPRRCKLFICTGNISATQFQYFLTMPDPPLGGNGGCRMTIISNNTIDGTLNTIYDKNNSNSRAIVLISTDVNDQVFVLNNQIRSKNIGLFFNQIIACVPFLAGNSFYDVPNIEAGVVTVTNSYLDKFFVDTNGAIYPNRGSIFWTTGAGSPEGVVTAPVGSLYSRTNGGANTTLYVKESGSGNTGWVGK